MKNGNRSDIEQPLSSGRRLNTQWVVGGCRAQPPNNTQDSIACRQTIEKSMTRRDWMLTQHQKPHL
ncbi:MAG: hypothetical protein ACI814_003570, partial [Mariniblastus sp.]